MNIEIERKFLVSVIPFDDVYFSETITQGYLTISKKKTIRVRLCEVGNFKKGFITIKGKSKGIARKEYEYEIPATDANELLNKMCKNIVVKTRHLVEYKDHIWEIDQFFGDNTGLIVAEVELQAEDEEVLLPPWVTKEVSDDPRYYNSNLSTKPYTTWKETV